MIAPAKSKAGIRVWLTLVAIVVLIGTPLLVAWVLVIGPVPWRPARLANYGALVVPPVSLKDAALADLEGKPAGLGRLLGKWNLVYVGNATCDAPCQTILATTRQVRFALGKDMGRVQRVFITDHPDPSPALRAVLGGYPELVVLTGEPDVLRRFRLQFPMSQAGEATQAIGLFIVDPQGLVMMRYASAPDAKGLLNDLKRLLRASRIG